MSQSTGRSDLLSFKRELLRSAQLDVQPLPASVRRQALLATTIAAATSAAAGTATAASASASLGAASSVALGLAKLGGIGALLVSVGTATYYATEGVWQPSHTIRSTDHAPIAPMRQGAPVPVAEKSNGVTSPIASPIAPVPNGVASSSATKTGTSVSNNAASSSARTHSPSPISPLMEGVRAGDPAPSRPMSPLSPLPDQAQAGHQQPRETLSQELALLDTARARLAAGEAGASLLQLDQYAHDFPNGALQPEAMFLRIQALSRVGQSFAVVEIGRRFLALYPTSPHADRVRALIESYSDDQNP